MSYGRRKIYLNATEITGKGVISPIPRLLIYDGNKREQIKQDLSIILGRPVKQLKRVLKGYGYDEDYCSNNTKASTYGMKVITKL